jgi:hypothetical protein
MTDDIQQPSQTEVRGAVARAVLNPEWLALEGKPHGELLLNENSYRCITVAPPVKCVLCGLEFPSVQANQFFDGKKTLRPICPVCWREKFRPCAECDSMGQVDSGGQTPNGGWFFVRCPVCKGAGYLTAEEDAALRNPKPNSPKL